MASWPTGIEAVQRLVEQARLQKIVGTRDGSEALLAAAARSLESAVKVMDTSPDDAYSLSYDAARRSLTAVLHAQGLRPTTAGGHLAVQSAIDAQFTEPPPRTAFRPFGRMRATRNRVEYEPVSIVNGEDAAEALALARAIHAVAVALVPNLPVFTD